MVDHTLILFSCNANPKLAQDIAGYLKTPLGHAMVGKFSDGEIQIEILDNVRGRDVFVVQPTRSEEHTSELQSLMRISYAVFCLKKKKRGRRPIPRRHRTAHTINSTHV